jgi:hypothetical protein
LATFCSKRAKCPARESLLNRLIYGKFRLPLAGIRFLHQNTPVTTIEAGPGARCRKGLYLPKKAMSSALHLRNNAPAQSGGSGMLRIFASLDFATPGEDDTMILLPRLSRTLLILAAAMTWTALASAGITITTDDLDFEAADLYWPQPETSNVIATPGQPKIEIVPDSNPNGLFNTGLNLQSLDLSNGKLVSQIFTPATNFKLGAIAMLADGIGTLNPNTPAPDDHLPLNVHLFELVTDSTGAATLPGSYTLSTAGPSSATAADLFDGGSGSGLELQFNGADEYKFVELNFTGSDQVQLQAGKMYAFEIWGNALTGGPFNPQRLSSASTPGGSNPYAGGDSYEAANTALATARARPSSPASRDMLIAIYEAVAQPGDFNGDGNVDGIDFAAWQSNFPKAADATLGQGDGDGDGDVDGADFVVWQTNFPFPSGSTTVVPEPGAVILAAIAMAILAPVTRCRYKARS